MFDIWKIRQELCKAYKIYDKKRKSCLDLIWDDVEEYEQLHDIQYAIAYVLCEYFDFNYELYYKNPFSYKWNIAYDYIHYYDECKRAYETITKQNKTNHNIVWSINGFKNKSNYSKGDMMYNIDNRCFYYYNGKNFIEMC